VDLELLHVGRVRESLVAKPLRSWHKPVLHECVERNRDDFEACSFINVLLEMGPEHPAGGASVWHLEQIRSIVRRLAEEAGLRDTETFARAWHILMKGSIISATEGDTHAAQLGKSMARLLIAQYR
jgi:hypothetical protein